VSSGDASEAVKVPEALRRLWSNEVSVAEIGDDVLRLMSPKRSVESCPASMDFEAELQRLREASKLTDSELLHLREMESQARMLDNDLDSHIAVESIQDGGIPQRFERSISAESYEENRETHLELAFQAGLLGGQAYENADALLDARAPKKKGLKAFILGKKARVVTAIRGKV
jgi:hypothetical protein